MNSKRIYASWFIDSPNLRVSGDGMFEEQYPVTGAGIERMKVAIANDVQTAMRQKSGNLLINIPAGIIIFSCIVPAANPFQSQEA